MCLVHNSSCLNYYRCLYVGPQLLLSKIEAYICGASTVCAISLHALIAPLINGGTFNYISRLSPMKIN